MKRVFFLFLFFILFLSGCSRSNNIDFSNTQTSTVTSDHTTQDNEDNSSAVLKYSSIMSVEPFINGYAWISFYNNNQLSSGYHYHSYIDKMGNTVFSDLNGLLDNNGNKYYIDRFFKEVQYQYYLEESDYEESGISEKPAYVFSDGYACLLCRDCEHNENGNYVACIIYKEGKVVSKAVLGCYLSTNYPNAYNYDTVSTSEKENKSVVENTTIYSNGHGTYFIEQSGFTCALSAEKGQLFQENLYNKTDFGSAIPKRNGYFEVKKTKSGFDYSETSDQIIDYNGNLVNDEKLKQYAFFVTDNVIYKRSGMNTNDYSHCFYNKSTKNEFSFENKESYRDSYHDNNGNKDIKNVILSNFENNSGKLYLIRKTSDYDSDKNIITFDYYNEDGKIENLTSYEYVNNSINCFAEKYILVETNDGYHCFNFENSKDFLFFDEYNNYKKYAHDIYICNGTIFCTTIGMDNQAYLITYDLDGKKVLSPTLYSAKYIEPRFLGFNTGIVIDNTIYNTQGEHFEYNKSDYIVSEVDSDSGWICVSNKKSVLNNDNYINIKGELMFK